jgi:hypothetical protein
MLPLRSDRPSAGSAGLAKPGPDVASFVPEAGERALLFKALKNNDYNGGLNLGQEYLEFKI